MSSRHASPAAAAALAAALLAPAQPLQAQDFQWPDQPENLEVLPEDIGSDGLRDAMTGFTDALGVRCSFCHEGEGDDLTQYDFASDEPEHKQTARTMLRMVRAINEEHLAELEDGGEAPRVRCVTCHRGVEEPRPIQDVIGEVVREEGAEAGVERYRELRDRYYGSFAYDFTAGPLAELGRQLAAEDRLDAGIRMAELETEYHPESYRSWFVVAQLRQRAGRTEAAIEAMERTLEHAPERARDFLRRQLRQLRDG